VAGTTEGHPVMSGLRLKLDAALTPLSASIYMRQPEQDKLHQYHAKTVAARTGVAKDGRVSEFVCAEDSRTGDRSEWRQRHKSP
jgi:hypothetical protein